MRIVFAGSPPFSVPGLRALHDRFGIIGVITRPDRPAGRGRSLQPTAVRQTALDLDLPCLQPTRLSRPESLKAIQDWKPDVIVVVAYGEILPPELLETPARGCLNLHASLLPRWRGASPIQAAILAGDGETGVTVMKMDAGLDTGPILSQAKTGIGAEETAGHLSARLATMGADLLVETLPAYFEGAVQPQPQPSEGVTSAPRLRKDSGLLDFHKPSDQLARQVRAFEPWPASFFTWRGRRIVVRQASAVAGSMGTPGQVGLRQGRPCVATSSGGLVLERMQPDGRRPMDGTDFVQGARGFLGADLSPAPTASIGPLP